MNEVVERLKAPVWVASASEVKASRPSVQTRRKDVWTFDCAADIEPTEVKWLWYPYVPQGRLTSIEGDPGIGKSWFTCALASAVSNGTRLPGDPETIQRFPGKVLMLSSEDGKADTLIPRLMAVGANLDNIYFPHDTFTLNDDNIAGLEKAMESMALTMVFIDPVQYYMGSKVDINRANEVRGFMGMLHQAAERNNCAVVLVRHLNKKNEGSALYRGLGSIDFAAALRSILHVSLATGGVRHVHHIKCNNAPEGGTLTYNIIEQEFEWGPVLPRGETVKGGKPISTTPLKQDVAREFLREFLATGGRSYTQVVVEASRRGISEATLKLSKKGIVESKKGIGYGGEWLWYLKENGETNEKLADGQTGRGSAVSRVSGDGPDIERGNGIREGEGETAHGYGSSAEVRVGDGNAVGAGSTAEVGRVPAPGNARPSGGINHLPEWDTTPLSPVDLAAARQRLMELRSRNAA